MKKSAEKILPLAIFLGFGVAMVGVRISQMITEARPPAITASAPLAVSKEEQRTQIKDLPTRIVAAQKSEELVQQKAQPQEDWRKLPPLSIEQEKAFAKTWEIAAKTLDWGSWSDEEFKAFQNELLTFGDNGIASVGRSLDDVSSDSIKSSEDAHDVIKKLDLMRFLVEKKVGVSLDVISSLALRDFKINIQGIPEDHSKSQVTLEAFELLSMMQPEIAMFYIAGLPALKVPAFVYHYGLGRKLAGEKRESTLTALRPHIQPDTIKLLIHKGII
jgi:hypothetical protein